jgi:hypothetical protein
MADTIAADEGSAGTGAVPTVTPQYGGYHSGYSHTGYSSGYSTQSYHSTEEYNTQVYEASGAGPATMWWMMGTVVMSYMFLFFFMGYSCFYRPVAVGFVQLDAETTMNKPQGPVSELDKQWRKAFVTKVYAVLCVQLAITVLICFSMMQCAPRTPTARVPRHR